MSGILKLPKGSPFLLNALEHFPIYDDEMANCWACVGPQLLTQTYNRMLAIDEKEKKNIYNNSDIEKNDSENNKNNKNIKKNNLPELVDSSILYGLAHYRNFFPNMS